MSINTITMNNIIDNNIIISTKQTITLNKFNLIINKFGGFRFML